MCFVVASQPNMGTTVDCCCWSITSRRPFPRLAARSKHLRSIFTPFTPFILCSFLFSFILLFLPTNPTKSQSKSSKKSKKMAENSIKKPLGHGRLGERRKSIPLRPQGASPNCLTLLKGCVGRDPTKMALPVEFNEPLSLLQRLTEELDYAHLLDLAAMEVDAHRRLAFVCAFAVSGYSTLGQRPTKPFNPLLGETFECDRRADRGWRSLAEQVSHHPPGANLHAEAPLWTLEQQYVFESKLKGTSICLTPIGHTHIRFSDGKVFSYTKLPTLTTLDSIVNGGGGAKNGGNGLKSASTECSGQFTVLNMSTGAKGVVNFHADKKGTGPKMVSGTVIEATGKERCRLEGRWDKLVKMAEVSLDMPVAEQALLDWEQIWAVSELPADSHLMHNFTQFAVELNEDEPGTAPTDSRRRPDQRLCELGEFGAANRLKKCLEEAQRQRVRERQGQGAPGISHSHRPLWFAPVKQSSSLDIENGRRMERQQLLQFTGEYWKVKELQAWDVCPELFAV